MPVATLHHDRRSERSFLFTMSNIALSTASDALAAAAQDVLCERSFSWWSQTESNRRPPACKAGALPTELWPLQMSGIRSQYSGACTPMPIPDPEKVVGLGRFELPTSRLSSARSNQLSYKPLGQETVISRRKSAPRRIAASCRSLTSDP